ncbi:MAG TPA: methyltransferase domain-containing protein [Solirubrobacteraceae bacterium]|nr:methyltransferase domain-containing protein [Solirubrobacteraceae bacterium]
MANDALHFAVLGGKDEIRAATTQLRARGWVRFGSPAARSRPASAVRRVLGRDSMLPDPVKSWDVLRALQAVSESTPRDIPVLDMGCVACPILPCLHNLGYTDLHGVDLDGRVGNMPLRERIDYRTADMTATPWPDQTFAAITAISVIEHGFDQDALLREVARLLRPGGAFIFSTDYWPLKLDTDGMRMFGLDWRIFSADEIEAMLQAARGYGLHPLDDPSAILRAPLADENGSRPVSCEGRHYTFLYGALISRSSPAGG